MRRPFLKANVASIDRQCEVTHTDGRSMTDITIWREVENARQGMACLARTYVNANITKTLGRAVRVRRASTATHTSPGEVRCQYRVAVLKSQKGVADGRAS